MQLENGNNYYYYYLFLTESKGEVSVNYSKCNLFSIEKTHKRPFFFGRGVGTLKPGKKKRIMFGMNVKILNFALVKFKNVLRLKMVKKESELYP